MQGRGYTAVATTCRPAKGQGTHLYRPSHWCWACWRNWYFFGCRQITCGHLANVWFDVAVTHVDTCLRTCYLSTPYPVCRFDELLFVEAFVCGHGAGLVNHRVQAGTAYKKALDIGCEIIKQVMTISFPVLSCRLLSPGGRESLVLLLFVGR